MFPFFFMYGVRNLQGFTGSRTTVIIIRSVLTIFAAICLGLAIYFPINWHTDFPEDGWFNPGMLFGFLFTLFSAMWLLYAYGGVQIEDKRRSQNRRAKSPLKL